MKERNDWLNLPTAITVEVMISDNLEERLTPLCAGSRIEPFTSITCFQTEKASATAC